MELGAQVEPSREVRGGDAPQSQSPMERSSNRYDDAGRGRRARRWECDGHFISSRRLEAAQVRRQAGHSKFRRESFQIFPSNLR